MLLFMDSFDYYVSADLLEKWTSGFAIGGTVPAITAGQGRHGSASLRPSSGSGGSSASYVTKTLSPTGATFIAGFGFKANKVTLAAGLPILSVYDGGTVQLTLMLMSDFTLQVKRGLAAGTLLATSGATGMALGSYAHIEAKFTIDPAVGTVEVRVNEIPVIPLTTALNTRNTANSAWNAFKLGMDDAGSNVTAWNPDYDDLHILDGSGAAPHNNFLGDCRCDPRFATAAGALTGWTPSAGANWAAVDDAAPNDDTDYNTTPTVGAIDLFVMQDVPVSGAVFGIQHCISVKKADVGSCAVAPMIRHGGVNYQGPTFAPSTQYQTALSVAQVDPLGAGWTETSFNAAEMGYKRVA